jgi:ribonuclease P protein component
MRSPENEKNISAKQYIQKTDTRIPGSHVDKKRQTGHQAETCKRAQKIGSPDSRQVVPQAFSFSKQERLRKRPEYLYLSGSGRKFHTEHFIIVRSGEVTGQTRLGITVSRKVGKAVVRNRIKRLVREYYRLHKKLFGGADYNLIAKKGADKLLFSDICQELDKVLIQIASRMKC